MTTIKSRLGGGVLAVTLCAGVIAATALVAAPAHGDPAQEGLAVSASTGAAIGAVATVSAEGVLALPVSAVGAVVGAALTS